MEKACKILVAGLDGAIQRLVEQALGEERATVVRALSASEALEALDDCAVDVLITDSRLPQSDGLLLLRTVQQRWPGMPVLLVTDQASALEIAEAIGAGASDILVPPLSPNQLAFAVQKALAVARRGAPAPPPPRIDADIVFGRSPAMKALHDLLQQVAPTSSTVLVRGESGTGKELVARALHRLSPRADRPFIKIDCTSLPDTLIESELFGYEKGAFTGASAQKVGRVQMANEGTLFLDEIGELSAPTQAKLLRLLQDREFERLGGKNTIRVDVRVVAATHRDLETMVARQSFRQDLFYRLNVVPLWIAPLRARRGDIEELAEHFCAQAAAASGKPRLRLSAEASRLLAGQRWPGNVRQLQNFVERLVVLCTTSRISEADVKSELALPVRFVTETGLAGADACAAPASTGNVLPLDEALRIAERQALLRALKHTGGNRSATARLLGVSRSTLYAKLENYELL
ncbi:MAG: sigma-54 dependent transcriptional regulator [Myxococcota bacterium]|nr:sigma-54 dependent transcriptional regulator [Myxococcota bacterium]